MGGPSSPLLGNICIDYVETLTIETNSFQPKFWERYIDDSLVIWNYITGCNQVPYF